MSHDTVRKSFHAAVIQRGCAHLTAARVAAIDGDISDGPLGVKRTHVDSASCEAATSNRAKVEAIAPGRSQYERVSGLPLRIIHVSERSIAEGSMCGFLGASTGIPAPGL
jgi:hypothetical protein